MNSYFGIEGNEESELEKQNRALARKAAAEGFVLLKNDNQVLPLKNKRIALYGMGARKTVKGGLGSGSVEERYSVTIEEGFQNAGYEVTSASWLDDYDAEYEHTYQVYHDMVEEKIAGIENPYMAIPLAHSFVYRFPSGREVTEADVLASETDTAVYVLMRQAGEGNDRKLESGDYYITDTERKNLEYLAKAYTNTILIINVGGLIDLAFLDEIKGIDAVVFFAQGGMEGGNALVDVLSGKVNFSGKLADTIPMKYEDIPFGNEYSYLNDNLKEEDYKEGIYVGYRYFDSAKKEVRYPFGYGLSYTEFVQNVEDVTIVGQEIQMTVSVENTGSRFSGKDVVQLYLSTPHGKLHHEYQSLVSFAKTGEIAPGKAEQITLKFNLKDAASYEEKSSAWILEKGSYLLRCGNSSRSTRIAAVIELDAEVVTVQCKQCCKNETLVEELVLPELEEEKIPSNVKHLTISADAFTLEHKAYDQFMEEQYELTETAEEKKLLDSLTPEEMLELLTGGNMQTQMPNMHSIPGMAGTTAITLLDKGIPNIALCDGPAGINIVNEVCFTEDGSCKPTKIPERYNWGILAKTMGRMISREGVIVHRYATAWPVEILLAQTWNTTLMKEIGNAVGQEMKLFGVNLWLAPGMNIHRNPLGGRVFEYYSEDPYLTGKMAAALTKGVQKNAGCGVTIKHFACNNTEDNRNQISSNVNERTLREIYLKGFEIAVKESGPKAVMSSYNQLNHVYTANNRELLTDILRCEWNYQGTVMTDWNSCNDKAAVPEKCPVAGNDLIMPGMDYDKKNLLAAYNSGELRMDAIRRCALRVLRLIFM